MAFELPTSAAARALAASLITRELIVLPVRHHSPACAWHVRKAIAEAQPSVVLVEGPRSFTELLPFLAHTEARMPLAIYTYAVQRGPEGEDDRRAAYYPFCDYSPELVAIREAATRQIPARFIDLDFAEQCQIEPASEDDESRSLLDERHFARSRYLHALAESLGCRDHEELWEHLFEVSTGMLSLEEHVARVTAYCHLARMECTDAELQADGTLQREAEMAWHIRAALAARPADAGPVLVVLGGFHAVVMTALLATNPVRPAISRSRISDESSALIRYSFDRLDRLNGYASGMTSPAWHQSLWELMLRHDKLGDAGSPRVRESAALSLLADVAIELRDKRGVALPMPALAAAYEQSLRLAHFRNRPAPARDDVLDAITSCFIKGDADADGMVVRAVAKRAFGGVAMGKVPPGSSTPPLVKDFQFRARRQRLKIDDSQPRRTALDLYRRPAHRVTSRLLHGLSLLGVPFAIRTAGPDFVTGIGLDRLQEHWEYSHTAGTEAALVEASVYGVTVPLAVANRFAARIDRAESDGQAASASASAGLVNQACVLGLHDHLPRLVTLLRGAIAQDASFDSLATAAGGLGLLWESREPLEARDLDALPDLLTATYERAIFLGLGLVGTKCDATATVKSLKRLRELTVSEAGARLDESMYWALIEALQRGSEDGQVRGAATGLRYSAGQLDEDALAEGVAGHLQGMALPSQSVAFLRGLLQTAREVCWQQPTLLNVLDGQLAAWSEDEFVRNLPELRLAFAEMTPKETDRIATAVAGLHGAEDLGRLVNYAVDPAQLQHHLQLSRTLAEILAADGLAEWSAS